MRLPTLTIRAGRAVQRPQPYRAARARLVAVNLLVVAGILALMAIAVYAWEVHATDQQVNDQLVERTRRALVEDGTADVALNSTPAVGAVAGTAVRDGNDHAAEQYEPSSPDVFMVVVNRQGVVALDPGNVRSLGLPDAAALLPVLAGRQPSTMVTLGDDQSAYRLYSTPIRQHGQIVGALQVGMSLAGRHRALQDLLLILMAVGSGVLVVTAAASFYLAGRALQPMREAYERQHRFAAAASHELRTPLAILRSEAELVARGLNRLAEAASIPGQATSSVAAGRRPGAAEAATSSVVLAIHDVDTLQAAGAGLPSAGPNGQRSQGSLAARLGDDVQEIVGEVDYMARLVDDLLLLARDETASGLFVQRDVDLVAVASAAVEKLASIARANELMLRFTRDTEGSEGADDVLGTPGSSDTLVVHGDQDRLMQLILILLDNAIRYTPAGGTIEVCVQQTRERHLVPRHVTPRRSGRGDWAVLSVRDTGAGIAAEDLPHLFEPFYRAKSVRTGGPAGNMAGTSGRAGPAEGAGLGLAVARWIVHAHGGTISAFSDSEPGYGATFTVSLPLA